MPKIIDIKEENFQTEVLEASVPVLVDFSAVWCGPCKMLDPVVDELAEEWGDSVKVVRLDVDYSPTLAMNYRVMSVPTLLLFNSGEPVERVTGYQPKARLRKKFQPYIS